MPADETSAPAGGTPAPSGPRAAFSARLRAFLIDTAILVVVFLALFAGSAQAVAQIVALVVNFTYFTCLEGSPSGQTIGKRLVGIRVVDLHSGAPIGYRRAVRRWLGRIVSQLPIFLGYFAMLRDRERQTWHDRFAGAVVVPVSEYPVASWPG